MRKHWTTKLSVIGVLALASALVAAACGVPQEDYDGVKSQLASEQQQAASLEQQLSAKVQEAAAVQQQVAAKVQEAEAVQKQVTAKEGEITTLKAQIAAKTGDATSLQQQLAAKVKEAADLQVSVTAIEKDVAALKQAIQSKPELAAITEIVKGKFTTFEKGVPLWDIQPGTAPRMRELTDSMNLIWYAAQADNFEFAGFEIYRLGEQLHAIPVTRPGRATGINDYAKIYLPPMAEAAKAKDKAALVAAYDKAVAGCNACHSTSTGGGFQIGSIKITRPTTPLFANVDYKGQ